ncbi:MAG TPA: DUF3122 domain-containing protein [Coleofasciculaceae cyanobacterium]
MVLKVFSNVFELAHTCRYLCRTQLYVSRLIVLSGLVLFLVVGQFTLMPQPAAAVLRQHQDAPGLMRYHSQQSLPDELGNAWQVVLFKQITPGKPTLFNLRLVGFPGIAEFTHPQPLEITTAGGKVLTAADVFAQGAPAPNVGQYNFTDVLFKLGTNGYLTLSVHLQGEKTLSLKIPQPLVVEWQWLANEL